MQSADLGGGGMAYYTYDAGGNRVRKVIENGNITEERIYLGDWEVYRRTINGTLDTERETLHLTDDMGRIALVDTETVGSINENIRYQMSNHLGSATLELDDAAAVISYEEYHPFGTTSYRSDSSTSEVSLKRYRYVGKERDDETGLYYYGARYYAAWLGRFVSTDPLKDDYPHLNPYNYADNNPVSDKDIDGQQNTKTSKRPKGLPEIPKFPNLPGSVREFVDTQRPDFREKISKQETKEGQRAVFNETKQAFGSFIEQTRSDLRNQLKQDFFIDKVDGKYKFDTKAFLQEVEGSDITIEEARNLKGRAGAILIDPQFDAFVFEEQKAKADAARAARKAEIEARNAQAAIDKEIKNILNPGVLGEVGQGVGLIGDVIEVVGEGLTATIFLGEAGVPIIFIGKGISALGTGLEIADDFQRLDPELAQELAGIRGAVLLVSEGIGLPGAKKALSEGLIKEKIKDAIISGGLKFGQKTIENYKLNQTKREFTDDLKN